MVNHGDFVLALFNARTAAHVAHLTTTSYAAHKALNEFYDAVVDIADRYAEAAMGCDGPIRFTGTTFKLERDPVTMLKALKAFVTKDRACCNNPMLGQIMDDADELISGTLYRLTLK